ncbi:hypothetical protein [Thiorhodospira sibirica]|uniref:hypothetical protein n=1 Tax=Thiorhodospira sibirica TaxID=154347 RepID=UPI00022C58CF|nr:hypothetical protein [Thiorhodospira sibirica]
MLKVAPKIILFKSIDTNIENTFSKDEIEQAARSILEGGGVINPLVVKRKGIERYDLVNGEFEYFSAKRAKEIDPIKGESIDAYIIEEDNAHVIEQQIKLFRHHAPHIKPETENGASPKAFKESSVNVSMRELQNMFSTLLQPLVEKIDQIQKILQNNTNSIEAKIDNRFEEMEDNLAAKLSDKMDHRLELIENRLANIEREKNKGKKVDPSPEPTFSDAWIEALNQITFEELTRKAAKKLKAKQINNLIAVRDTQPFVSEQDVRDVQGIGPVAIKHLKALLSDVSTDTQKAPVADPPVQDSADHTPPAKKTQDSVSKPQAPQKAEQKEQIRQDVYSSISAFVHGMTVEKPMPPELSKANDISTEQPIPPKAAAANAKTVEKSIHAEESIPTIIPPELITINNLSKKEIAFKLSRAKVHKMVIEEILKKHPFESLEEIQRINKIGKNKINHIINTLTS